MGLDLQKKKKPEYLNSSVKLREMGNGWILLPKVRVLDYLFEKELLNYMVERFGSTLRGEIKGAHPLSHYH